MYTVFDIADWFLANAKEVTNKKLQKLVYYAYSWYLVFNNESVDTLENRFFTNNFEAWVHGCVDPCLYEKYRNYGSSEIPVFSGKLKDFSADDKDVLNQVLEVYGNFNGNELENICHQELPWINARGGISPTVPSHTKVKDCDIFNYYVAKLNGQSQSYT